MKGLKLNTTEKTKRSVLKKAIERLEKQINAIHGRFNDLYALSCP